MCRYRTMCLPPEFKMVTPPDVNNPKVGDIFWLPATYKGDGSKVLRQIKVVSLTTYWSNQEKAVTFEYVDFMPTGGSQTVRVDYFKTVAKLTPPVNKVGRRVSLEAIFNKGPCYDGLIRAIQYWQWKLADKTCKLDMYQAFTDGKLSESDAMWLIDNFGWRKPKQDQNLKDWIMDCLLVEK